MYGKGEGCYGKGGRGRLLRVNSKGLDVSQWWVGVQICNVKQRGRKREKTFNYRGRRKPPFSTVQVPYGVDGGHHPVSSFTDFSL